MREIWSSLRPVVIAGLLITTAVSLFGISMSGEPAATAPSGLAAEILITRGGQLLDDDFEEFGTREHHWYVDPGVISRFASSPVVVKQVINNNLISQLPRIQKEAQPELLFAHHLKVTTPDTNCLRIEFTAGNDVERAAVANAVADAVINEFNQRVSLAHAKRLAAIDEALSEAKLKLSDWRRAHERLQKRVQINPLGKDGVIQEALWRQLAERRARLLLDKVALDARLAAFTEATGSETAEFKEVSNARLQLVAELDQLEKLRDEEIAKKANHSTWEFELSELDQSIADITVWKRKLTEKRDRAKLRAATSRIVFEKTQSAVEKP